MLGPIIMAQVFAVLGMSQLKENKCFSNFAVCFEASRRCIS